MNLYEFKKEIMELYLENNDYPNVKSRLGVTTAELMVGGLDGEEDRLINCICDIKEELTYSDSVDELLDILMLKGSILTEAYKRAKRRMNFMKNVEKNNLCIIPESIIEFFEKEYNVNLSKLEIFLNFVNEYSKKMQESDVVSAAVRTLNLYFGDEYLINLRSKVREDERFNIAYRSIILGPMIHDKFFKKVETQVYAKLMEEIRN